MIALDEALARMLAEVRPLPVEEVTLAQAAGRTLGAAVHAQADLPAEPRSAMDGIAIPGDGAIGDRFTIVGDAYAGRPWAGSLAPREAARVATGGVVPNGARRVVPKELVSFVGDTASLVAQPGAARFIRPAGGDFRAGELLLAEGRTIDAQALALIAAANCAPVCVRARPSVAVLVCGDELIDAGEPLPPGATVDSAGPMVATLARGWGADVRRLPRVGDDEEATRKALADAVGAHELIVTVGGASVGDRDGMRPAAVALGARLLFERVAIQPGKPSWFARLPDGGSILGLPGNPASAFACAFVLLRPLIDAMLGRERERPLSALLATGASASDRTLYLRGTVRAEDGVLVAEAATDQDSSLVSVLARSNALIEIPAHRSLEAREPTSVILTGSFVATS